MNWLAQDMVERLARALAFAYDRPWPGLGPSQREHYRDIARKALTHVQESA